MCLSEVRKSSGEGRAYKVVLQHEQNILSIFIHPADQVIFNKEGWNEAKLKKIPEGYTSGFHCFSNLKDARRYAAWLKKRLPEKTSEVWEVEYQEKTFTGYEAIAHEKFDSIVANKIKFIRQVA